MGMLLSRRDGQTAAEGHSNRAKDTEILEEKHVPNHAWTTFSFRHQRKRWPADSAQLSQCDSETDV